MSVVYDAAVVGAGIIGSWTAYSLQKNGAKTVLLEQVINDLMEINGLLPFSIIMGVWGRQINFGDGG